MKPESKLTNSALIPERKGIPHNCAIAGVYAPGKDVAGILVDALSHLNHRGQEGAGVWVKNDTGDSRLIKSSGLVKSIFGEKEIEGLRDIAPTVGIGQDRYSTSGTLDAWQPFVDGASGFALAHNGNLTNAQELLKKLPEDTQKKALSDTWIAHKTIVEGAGENWEEKIANAADKFEGAFSLVMQAENKLYALRDPLGMRPLVLGELPGGGYVVASETSAFTPLKIKFVRELDRGERIVIDENGVRTFSKDARVNETSEKKCVFERLYIKAPDSNISQVEAVSKVRYEIGRSLAGQDADVGFYPERVVGIQESGVLYTQGYYEEITRQLRRFPEKFGLTSDQANDVLDDVRMVTGFVKNPYAVNGKRIFMEPDTDGRGQATFDKHRVNPFDIEGKKVVVIDDSIVRGTTSVRLVKSASEVGRATYGLNGPSEIHLRVGSEKIIAPCFWGVDFATVDELAVGRFSDPSKSLQEINEDIRLATGADSLKYATAIDVVRANVGEENFVEGGDPYSENGFCGHCFTGIKPEEVKGIFARRELSEQSDGRQAKPENSNGNAYLNEGETVLISKNIITIPTTRSELGLGGMFNPVEID